MLNIIIIAFLIFGLLRGLKRGFILQSVHLFGFIISFIIAVLNYKKLAPHLSLWIPYPELSGDSAWALFLQALPLETGFYNGIAFVVIFFSAKIGLQIFAAMIDFIAELPILHSMNRIFGALLGFVEVYLILFVLLYILAFIPIETVQTQIEHSFLAKRIVENTPYL